MVDYAAASRNAPSLLPPVLTLNTGGQSPFVLVCDHASNRIPQDYGDLGLSAVERTMHIAWDPGALAVARRLAELLDAPLIQSTVSRLVVDCNRGAEAQDLMPVLSERTEISGNREVGDAERGRRIADFHTPFHATIDALLELRAAIGMETVLVTIHSFTPTYKDVWRRWPVGLIHGTDPAFTTALQAALLADEPGLNVGWNEPYSAMTGVTYTLEHHGDGRGLNATMIEIRHDEILEPSGVAMWAGRLARCLEAALEELHGMPDRVNDQPITGQ
jgi:predicted N-formylglutamate amidohydrolase